MSHLLLWGNAYAQIIRDGRGNVLSFYPLLPDRMTLDRTSTGELYYEYRKDTGSVIHHNAGDFGQALIHAPHDYSVTEEQLDDRTDGHMDINRVREGAVLICPVKVPGGGVYLGDMHAMQGDGEIAGHTTDVAGIVNLQANIIKGLNIAGPILLPVEEDLPHLARPFNKEEKQQARRLSEKWGVQLEESYPISFVGSGATLNDATTNGMERAAELFGITVPEVMNRATINGAIEIGRNPGVVTVTFLAPKQYLESNGLLDLILGKYGE